MSNREDSRPLNIVSIDVFSQSAPIPNRVNEDGWLIVESQSHPNLVTFAVIDGAGVRIKLPSLAKHLIKKYPNLTASAFVTTLLKSHLLEQFQRAPNVSLSQALINANGHIRQSIEKIVGSFDPKIILSELNDDILARDSRNLRLVLPACVITLMRLDIFTRQLEYVHVGDTCLVEIYHDGQAIRHTKDQMGPFDRFAFEGIMNLQARLNLPHFKDAVTMPEGRDFIVKSGLRLNYVDLDGNTNRENGCGVVNGMQEMEDYIETGLISINQNSTLGFALLTDGLVLPAPLHEHNEDETKGFLRIASLIRHDGLRGLYNEIVKLTDNDIYFDRFPRTKLRDDATGIYIQIEKKES